MVEWSIQSLGARSSESNLPFQEGDEVLCLLLLDEGGQWRRADILAAEWEGFSDKEKLIGRWHRSFSPNKDAAAKKQKLLDAEEFFLSLFAVSSEQPSGETMDALKQILGLFLERKRILKRLPNSENPIIKYLHSNSKEVFEVVPQSLSPEWIQQLPDFLEFLR